MPNTAKFLKKWKAVKFWAACFDQIRRANVIIVNGVQIDYTVGSDLVKDGSIKMDFYMPVKVYTGLNILNKHKEILKEFMSERKEYKKANRFNDVTIKVYI